MSSKELLSVIPELLLLFIPGFITLRIKEEFSFEKKHNKFDSVMYSVLYSFVIGIVYYAIQSLINYFSPIQGTFLDQKTAKQIFYLLISLILGYLLVRLHETKVFNKLEKKFNNHYSHKPSVWVSAMENKEGAWATVTLKNGMIYMGKLIAYSSDIDFEGKALILSNYRFCIKNEKQISDPAHYCIEIENKDSDDDKVYLNGNDIISVEILKPNSCTN